MDSDTWWNNMSGAQVIAIGQNSGIFNPDAAYKGRQQFGNQRGRGDSYGRWSHNNDQVKYE